jgi:Ankyrin repeats (3 copies)/Ankyrin repeats (many copies)
MIILDCERYPIFFLYPGQDLPVRNRTNGDDVMTTTAVNPDSLVEATSGTSFDSSKICSQNVVRSIVYRAMISLSGRELSLKVRFNHVDTHKECYDFDAVMQWRNELFDLVQKTVRFSDHYRSANLDEQELRTKMFDIEIRTPTAFLQRYGRVAMGKKGTTKSVTIVSDMGIVRDIQSSYQLASQYLHPLIEQELSDLRISHHVRVAAQSGFICAASIEMMQFMKEKWDGCSSEPTSTRSDKTLHLESCPLCPLWCRGSKGLWWHLQQQHTIVHCTATATANIQIHRNSTAIVVCNKPPTTLPIISSQQPTRIQNETVVIRQDNHAINHVPSTSPAMNKHDQIVDPWQCIREGPTLDQFVESVLYHQFDCPTARDKHGALILHWAAGGGHLVIVQYLLEMAQCDATAMQWGQRAYAGRTALHWAARYGHVAVVEYLLQRCIGLPSPSKDVERGALRSFIDAPTADGTTPFCWAAWQGHLSVMQLLYKYGCQVNIVNQFGCNAILWAAQGCGDISVFEWLIEVGCPDWVLNHSGHGTLHKGAQRGRREVCVWFIERMTSWLLRETNSSTCLAVLKLLGPDNDGCTPSDLAGMEHHELLAIYLSEQEQQMIGRMATPLSTMENALPPWLSKAPKSIIYSDSERKQHQMTWEPGAGVSRMQSVLYNVR